MNTVTTYAGIPRMPAWDIYLNTTPFTTRDADTYILILKNMHAYLNELALSIDEFDARIKTEVDRIIAETISAMNDIKADVDSDISTVRQELADAVDMLVNNTAELQDAVITALLGDSGSGAYSGVSDIVSRDTKTILVEKYRGAGVSDSDAIEAAVAAANNFDTIRFPNDTINLTRHISNSGKSLSFDAKGTLFMKDGDHDHVHLSGGFEEIFYVTSLTTSTFTEGDRTRDSVVIVMANAPSWRRGDYVKVVSTDVIPGTRDEGLESSVNARMGQFFPVYKVEGNVVTLAGKMFDEFTTNIRVARIKDIALEWEGGRFDVSEAHIAAGYTSRTIQVTNAMSAKITAPDIIRTTSAAISVNGCLNPVINSPVVRWAYNSLTEGGLGYAIANFSSQGLRVNGLSANTCRSGYTDGHGYITGLGDTLQHFGRPAYTTITGSHAIGCGTGFGTHSSGIFTNIDSCIVSDCYAGVSFRGRENRASNVIINNARTTAVSVFSEINSRSHANSFDGITVNGCEDLISVSLNRAAASPWYGERETRPSTFRNFNARRVNGKVVTSLNATLAIDGVYAEVARPDAVGAVLVYENSHVTGDNYLIDVNQVVNSGALAFSQFIDPLKPSHVTQGSLRVRGPMQRFNKLVHANVAHRIRYERVEIDNHPASTMNDTLSLDSWVNYRIGLAGERSSASILLSAAQAVDAASLNIISSQREPIASVRYSGSTAVTLGSFPLPAFRGQFIVLTNTGTGSITVSGGGATLRVMSATKTLATGDSLIFVATNTSWQEVKLV